MDEYQCVKLCWTSLGHLRLGIMKQSHERLRGEGLDALTGGLGWLQGNFFIRTPLSYQDLVLWVHIWRSFSPVRAWPVLSNKLVFLFMLLYTLGTKFCCRSRMLFGKLNVCGNITECLLSLFTGSINWQTFNHVCCCIFRILWRIKLVCCHGWVRVENWWRLTWTKETNGYSKDRNTQWNFPLRWGLGLLNAETTTGIQICWYCTDKKSRGIVKMRCCSWCWRCLWCWQTSIWPPSAVCHWGFYCRCCSLLCCVSQEQILENPGADTDMPSEGKSKWVGKTFDFPSFQLSPPGSLSNLLRHCTIKPCCLAVVGGGGYSEG